MTEDKLKQANKRFFVSVMALLIAVLVTISACFAWFYFGLKVNSSPFEVYVVNRAFAMGYIKIEADGELVDTNEFRGLLPGMTFEFEMEIRRKAEGDLYFRVDFLGVKGEEFIGKRDKKTHNMTELFRTANIDRDSNIISPPVFFNTNENGKLNLVRNVHLPVGTDMVVVNFMIQFSATQVPITELPEDISKKVFDIGNIFINDDAGIS